ncbi:hypothetical protein ACFZAU_20280 [Streptomyces sp. NPDC008238]
MNGTREHRRTVNRLWQEHRRAPFPPGLRGAEPAGVAMVLLDATVAGCALSLPSPVRRHPPRTLPLEPVKVAIDRMLRQDLDAPPGARHTISRIIERLRTEEDFTGASYSTVRDHVRARRIALAAQSGPPEG